MTFDIVTVAHQLLESRWRHQGRGWDFLFDPNHLLLAESDFEAWRALLREQFEGNLETGKANGFDCVGFVLVVHLIAGWTPPDLSVLCWNDYARVATQEHMITTCQGFGAEIPLAQSHPGDVVVIKFESDFAAQHIGLLTRIRADGVQYIEHAYNQDGEVVEHRLSKEWRDRVQKVFRFNTDSEITENV